MKKIYYEKIGRRYVPVSEYDSTLMDAFPKGTHLVQSYPGGKSTHYNIDPNYAAMIAAGRVAADAVCKQLRESSKMRSTRVPLTPEEHAAWENLIEVWGDSARQLQWPATQEIAQAAVDAMITEAYKLMQNQAVRRAYEQFQIICQLTKEQ